MYDTNVPAPWLQAIVYSNEELYRSEAGIHFVDKLQNERDAFRNPFCAITI